MFIQRCFKKLVEVSNMVFMTVSPFSTTLSWSLTRGGIGNTLKNKSLKFKSNTYRHCCQSCYFSGGVMFNNPA